MSTPLPAHGRPWAEIKAEMAGFSTNDVKWREGRHAFHVWYGGDDIFEVQRQSYAMYMQENGGGAGKTFKSLKIMEDAVVSYAASLLNGTEATGHITSGGSESIFVAMKAARDWARKHKPEISSPEVVIPFSGHPTFNRAAEYLGLTIVRVPVAQDLRGDVAAMEAAITANTIALVGSAVCFPYGVVDPISDLSDLAQRKNLWLHVDACIAGLQAPFARELGYEVPDFDFVLPGVSSISADLHKYGFGAKGSSLVLYANVELASFQPFNFFDWPLGQFSNPNVASTRPGGSIASSYAVMNYLGHDGYLALNKRLMNLRDEIMDGINAIPGLTINGTPHSLIISFGPSDQENVDGLAIYDEMSKRDWYLGRSYQPRGMMMGISLPHEHSKAKLLADLAECAEQVIRTHQKSDPNAPLTY